MANGSGLGAGSKLFLTVDIDMLGEKQLGQLQKMLQSTGIQAENANQNLNTTADSMDNAGSSANQMGGEFEGVFGKYMNLMFAGMALNMVLGRMRGTMLQMTGASAAMGAAMKSTLLPVFLAINPAILQFSSMLIQLPRPAKMLIGILFMLASALALLMFVGGQAGLFWMSFGEAIKSAAGNLLQSMSPALTAVKNGLLTVASALKTAIVSTLTYVASAVSSAISATYAWATANSALLASMGSILLIVGSLALGLLFLTRIFKKFGPVVGLLATVLGGALLAVLSPVAAVVFTIFGAFKAVNKIFKKFGKIVGTIAAVVIAGIGVLIAAFASVPVGIGLAIGAVLALIWNFRDEIVNALQGLWQFIKKWTGKLIDALLWPFRYIYKKIVGNSIIPDLVKDVKKWLGDMLNFITSLPSKIVSMAKNFADATVEIGKSIVNGVVDGIKSIGDSIGDTFFGFLPGPLATAVKGVSKFSSGLVSRIQNVLTPDDFILTSGGKMIQPASNDTIVGFNGNGPIQPGAGGGGNVEVNINDPVMKEDVDVERVVDEVEDRVNRDTRGRTGGLGT